MGIDRILWGNDYPHYEGCYPLFPGEHALRASPSLPEADVRRILGRERGKALYGFDLEALRPAANAAGITPELVAQPLTEIPKDSQCLAFLRARAEGS